MKIARRTLNVGIPTFAMGDIVFNLLIFFVILAKATDDSHVKWTPAETEKLESVGNRQASVAVDKDNKVYLDGRQVGLRDLAGGLEEALGNAPPGKRIVLLKIHNETLAATFEPIMEAVSEAGGEVVHVLQPKETK